LTSSIKTLKNINLKIKKKLKIFKKILLKYKNKQNRTDSFLLLFGLGYLCPAVSRAVKTMRKGEKAELAVNLSCKFVHFFPSQIIFLVPGRLPFFRYLLLSALLIN
jgi:hypothetical protein